VRLSLGTGFALGPAVAPATGSGDPP
jgi:hypothetical protein